MNFLQVIESYQFSENAKGFSRKGWGSLGLYCYISDIDFCVWISCSPDESEHYSYGPDIQANDWELYYENK